MTEKQVKVNNLWELLKNLPYGITFYANIVSVGKDRVLNITIDNSNLQKRAGMAVPLGVHGNVLDSSTAVQQLQDLILVVTK